MSYIDLYLLPVPLANVDGTYPAQAGTFREVLLEYGALNYREFKADAGGEGTTEFVKLVTVQPDEVLTTAVAEFESKAHRDEVMAKVMADSRIAAMADDPVMANLADMSRMHYGGFEQFIGD